MKRKLSLLLIVVFAAILAACAPGTGFSLPIAIPGFPSPTPTECGCKVKGTVIATPTGGIGLSGPAGPSNSNATPAPSDSQWTTYTNAKYGFSFEVPAAYNEGKYQFCAARAGQVPEGSTEKAVINLGSRTVISLYPANGKSVQDLVDAFKADPANKDATFDQPRGRTIAGSPALTLPYHSGGTNRYGESTFFIHGDTLYRVDAGSPSACDIDSLSLREIDAYAHLLQTFKFK